MTDADHSDAVWTVLFPLTMVTVAFAASESMPVWLGFLAGWNPLSATIYAARELFGNPGSDGTSWVAQNAMLMAVVWPRGIGHIGHARPSSISVANRARPLHEAHVQARRQLQMTNETPERQGGAWIGQHPDENTEQVRENLPDGAERVAVTNNESEDAPVDTGPAQGHREGGGGGDDALREAGQNR